MDDSVDTSSHQGCTTVKFTKLYRLTKTAVFEAKNVCESVELGVDGKNMTMTLREAKSDLEASSERRKRLENMKLNDATFQHFKVDGTTEKERNLMTFYAEHVVKCFDVDESGLRFSRDDGIEATIHSGKVYSDEISDFETRTASKKRTNGLTFWVTSKGELKVQFTLPHV